MGGGRMKKLILFTIIISGIFILFSSIVTAYETTDCQATGGSISFVGNYCVHTFLSNGNFTPTEEINNLSYLIVAGGGGGGGRHGGGGGGGGMLNATGINVTAQLYSIIIGNGGGGAQTDVAGDNGENSSFNNLIAIAGGGGGSYGGGSLPPGKVGGSGGGGGHAGVGAAGTAGQGFAGGNGDTNEAAGGGGAGAAGANGVSNVAGGVGGVGIQNNIDGNNYYWAGGGGGTGWTVVSANGGTGGGGGGGRGNSATGAGLGGGSAINNGSDGIAGTSGAVSGGHAGNNSGGGGGGSGQRDYQTYTGIGGNGGSGIVIVKYLLAQTTYNITGTLKDSDTNNIAGIVYILNQNTNVTTFTMSDSSGNWIIDGLLTEVNYTINAYDDNDSSLGGAIEVFHQVSNATSNVALILPTGYTAPDSQSVNLVLGQTGQCSPTLNADWEISDAQICDGVNANTGTGITIFLTGGNLTIIGGSNVTTNGIKKDTAGDIREVLFNTDGRFNIG